MSTVSYRLRIRDASDSSDALVVTSVRSGTNPFISRAPSGDGQGFDPRTGKTEVGAYSVQIADNGGAANVITGFLSDGTGRYDKLGRRAYLEYSTDGGSTWPNLQVAGYVTGISYPSAAEASVTIGEAQRAERNRQAFAVASGTTAGVGTVSAAAGTATFTVSQAGALVNGDVLMVAGAQYTVSAFNGSTSCTLAGSPTFAASSFTITRTSFPATTMLGGGPVRWPASVVTPANLPNRGPWTVQLVDTSVGATLRFVSGYVLKSADDADYSLVTDGALPPYMVSRINTLTATEVPGVSWGPADSYYHGNVYVDLYSAGALVGTFHVTRQRGMPGLALSLPGITPTDFLYSGYFAVAWNPTDPVGTQYQCYLYTRTVSENSPLHIFAHPVAVVTGLLDDAAEPWDSASATAITNAIGADVRVFLRVTSAEPTEAFIARIMRVFGFGRRMNSANVWEFFDARTKSTGAPATTITLADLREIPRDVWSLDESTILNNVTMTTERFALWAPGQSSSRPADDLVPIEQKRTARYQLADGSYPETTQGIKELSYDLPGTILNANTTEANLTDFTAALAAPAFDRWGTGAPSTTLACRDTVTAKVGDEVLLNLNFLPNANVRGGQRIVQVLQRTNEPGGPVLRVEDAGVSAQAAVAPTISITASARNPGQSADVTLTNAAALTSAGVTAVVVEFAVSASSPSGAGQDLGSITPYAPLVLTTPAAAGGATVWARAKSVQVGKRAGAFTAWASVTLSGVGAPASLAFTATSTDGSAGTLGWTVGSGSSNYAVRVLLRPSALTSTSDALVQSLQPGSIAAPLNGLTPGASYTATVQYVDPVSGIVAASASLTFTAGATTLTLTAPTSPVGIVGSTDATGTSHTDGTYGLDVTATVVPGVVEFWQAVETAVGSGLYGAAALLRTVASVSNGVTSVRAVAPNDRLHRQLMARHVRQGATPSDFTVPVTVDAWGATMGTPVTAELLNIQRTDTATQTTLTWTPSASVAEVWTASSTITAPETSGAWDAVAAAVTPLAAGVSSLTVPRPADGQVVLVQLEPRRFDLSAGVVRRLALSANPQPPIVELDDSETATVGTQWWKITERGIPVSSVQVQTQIGASPVSAWGAPTRSAGAASTVRGGTLGAGEYEHDVTLDADRQSWIVPRLNLSNGAAPVVLGPFAFDRDKNPNLLAVTVSGTVITVLADSDTRSIRIRNSAATWTYFRDVTGDAVDVSLADGSGAAGLGASASDTYTVEAFALPSAYVTGGTTKDSRKVTVSGASYAPTAAWVAAACSLAAPAIGDNHVTLSLKATAAPAGYTVKVYEGDALFALNPNPTTDITASVSPPLSAPPTATTAYTWPAPYSAVAALGGSRFTVRMRADLLNASSVVVSTVTLTTTYYVSP